MITQERFLEILRELPEVRLEIVDLTWKLVGEDGQFDEKKVSFHYEALEKAAAQAEAYASNTKKMLLCLTNLLR